MRWWLAAWLCLAVSAARLPADEIDYTRDVRPIFERHCHRCHGAENQESGLRLDSLAGMLAGGYSGPAIVRGKPAESLLLKAVTGSDDASRMPPEDEGDPLSNAELAMLRRWIELGATAPADAGVASQTIKTSDHWAFQPIRRADIPQVDMTGWNENAIDAFVLAKLAEAGLTPSPPADRATLIRRLSLDLLGLPPSTEEVDAFVSDQDPCAYERLVDRLLESPHYGERWGRHWLDAARYADSNGYTIDGGRTIWKYRDWVISALNADMPFDQFATEQLAGDLLPSPTIDQLVATGFHRNTLKNEEGGTDQEQFRVEAVVDRVSTTGTVFLGLTIACARCHDHKYDPISQREFYELFALFNNVDEPTLPVPTNSQAKELPALLADIASAEKRRQETRDNSKVRQLEWEASFAGRLDIDWRVVEPSRIESSAGTRFARQEDGSYLASGAPREPDTYTLWCEEVVAGLSAIRIEALVHSELPSNGPGRAANGNFLVSEVEVVLVGASQANGAPGEETPLDIKLALGDTADRRYPVANIIDGQPRTVWSGIVANKIKAARHASREALLVLRQPVAMSAGERLKIVIRHRDASSGIGAVRVSLTDADPLVVALSQKVRVALAKPAGERTEEESRLVREEFYRHDADLIPLDDQIAELNERKQKLEAAVTSTLIVRERPAPRESFIHVRGDFLRPGAAVAPNVPRVLPAMEYSGGYATRLDFAHWLFDGRNPLTARVAVNRLWQQYFGQGLVATENDFGTQADPRTHPELLDWLAEEFMARGWSLKAMHRLIVTSATYRQSSDYRADLARIDPNNKLLGRQARLRLEAEAIRDSALTASGRLSREIGGPSVYPPQPEGVYAFTQQKKFWGENQGADRYRRGLYTYFWRSSPYPFLTTFDAPDGNTACTRRPRSNTPLQALTLANDRAFVELAQGLAERLLREVPAGGDVERARHAFRLCLVRQPSDQEIDRMLALVAAERERFSRDPDAARAAAPPAAPAHIDTASAAAWTSLGRVLLNVDEFVTRE